MYIKGRAALVDKLLMHCGINPALNLYTTGATYMSHSMIWSYATSMPYTFFMP